MAKLVWNRPGENVFQTGVDQGVLYPMDRAGVPWNGLVAVEQSSDGGDLESFYFDGIKYFDMVSGEDFKATVEAFTYPPEFDPCLGEVEIIPGMSMASQFRQTFGLAWRTKLGNDLDGQDAAYKIHMVWNATAAPSSRRYQTLNDSPELANFNFEIKAVPTLPGMDLNDPFSDPADWVWPAGFGMAGWPMGPDGNTPVPGWRATSYVMVRSDQFNPDDLKLLEDKLFGTLDTLPFLPTQLDVAKLLTGIDTGFNYPFDPGDIDPGGGGGGGEPVYEIRRVQADAFSGAPGSAYTPPTDPHGGDYVAYIDPQGGPVVQAGDGQLFFPEYIEGTLSRFLWRSYSGTPAYDYASVCGYEVTFTPVSNAWQDLSIEAKMVLGNFQVTMGIKKNRLETVVASPGGPFFGEYELPYANIDTTAWLTMKLLPNGNWSLGYAGGTNIVEGNFGSAVSKTLGDPDHTYRGSMYLDNSWDGYVDYSTDPATVTGAVSGMRIKDFYFWVDEPI